MGVQFSAVSKHFGDVRAVDAVDLVIDDGEFFSLLGPSGSGKTTCLRLLGGFETLTEGRITLDDADLADLPPYRRDINTVFQDYALFPHMTVAENVGYGLKVSGIGKSERVSRVGEALEMVHLDSLGDRKPSQLSGGQRQRVALARALIKKPSVLLLDEPLGALDLKLRRAMQAELKTLQRDVGITFVFVTHDQEEALTMSDRIAVVNEGKIAQVGTPSDLYEQPTDEFVANFVGTSNVLDAETSDRLFGRSQPCTIRPERLRLRVGQEASGSEGAELAGRVVESTYLGMYFHIVVDVGPTELTVAVPNTAGHDVSAAVAPGQQVVVECPLAASHWLKSTQTERMK